MTSTGQAWTAFLLSSALIIGTFLPVINFGYLFIYYPVILIFGCENAQSGADCMRILLVPFVPAILTIAAFIGCRIAISRTWYAGSVLVAALACAASWLFVLLGLS
jgi:hypothetical protein